MPYILRDSSNAEIGRSASLITLEGATARSSSETWLNLPQGCTVVHEADPPPVPDKLTRRQARQILWSAKGVTFDQIRTYISGLQEPTRTLGLIFFDESNDFERNNPMLLALAPGLGLTSDDLDALFIAGAALA